MTRQQLRENPRARTGTFTQLDLLEESLQWGRHSRSNSRGEQECHLKGDEQREETEDRRDEADLCIVGQLKIWSEVPLRFLRIAVSLVGLTSLKPEPKYPPGDIDSPCKGCEGNPEKPEGESQRLILVSEQDRSNEYNQEESYSIHDHRKQHSPPRERLLDLVLADGPQNSLFETGE